MYMHTHRVWNKNAGLLRVGGGPGEVTRRLAGRKLGVILKQVLEEMDQNEVKDHELVD